MFPCRKTVSIEACSPYQNNASPAKRAANLVQIPGPAPFVLLEPKIQFLTQSQIIVPEETFSQGPVPKYFFGIEPLMFATP
jgi:hypothetical protein